MKRDYSREKIYENVKQHTFFCVLTLKYGIGGRKNWHVHSRVVGVRQPDDTVGTVMCDAPIVV